MCWRTYGGKQGDNQGVISSKDKEIWFSVLVWLTRLFFSFPEGLGSVNQITAFEAASSQGTDHTEEAWLSHSAFCLLLMGGPWWIQLGVHPPALWRCHVFYFQMPGFVFCLLFSHHLEKSALRFKGPPGKGSSSWENFKNLRLSGETRGVDWGYC